MNTQKTTLRLGLLLGLFGLLSVVVGLLGLLPSYRAQQDLRRIQQEHVSRIWTLNEVAASYVRVSNSIQKANLGVVSYARANREIGPTISELRHSWSEYMAQPLQGQELQIAQQVDPKMQEAISQIEEATDLMEGADSLSPASLAAYLHGTVLPHTDRMVDELAGLEALHLQQAGAIQAASEQHFSELRIWGTLAFGLVLALLAWLAAVNLRALGAQIRGIRLASAALAEGETQKWPLSENPNDLGQAERLLEQLRARMAQQVEDMELLKQRQLDGLHSATLEAKELPGSFRAVAEAQNAILEHRNQETAKAIEFLHGLEQGQADEAPEKGTGEAAKMSKALEAMRKRLLSMNVVIGETFEMHEKGEIDYFIDPEKIPGIYGRVMMDLNTLVKSHISAKKKAMATVARFAQGDFDAPLEQFPGKKAFINDNIELLRANMRKFIEQMRLMAAAHEAGDIDVRLDAERFPGIFQVMAEGVNEMVFGHISVKKKAMATVARFAEGDFDAPLEQFPGKKAFINDNIELLRANFKQFIREMNKMSEEHDLGDIDVTIPEKAFKGEFRGMAAGVNKMVFGHISVKKKAMNCVAEFGKGNFEYPIEQFPGKKAFINATIEDVRANLKGIMAEVNALIEFSKQGKLKERANPKNFRGDWQVMTKGLNEMLDAILLPIQEGNRVLARISQGDLTQSVSLSLLGEHQDMKNAVNSVQQWLSTMVGIIKRIADGDLTASMTRLSDQDELTEALIRMVGKLNEIVAQVHQASYNVSNGSLETSRSSEMLSQGASEQASSIEEVSSSIEQMTANISQNTDNAMQTEKIALRSASGIEEGYRSVETTVAAMREIAQKITIISDIAGKTNLLAINAAIEAARAGTHGKGFAVVAAEVRKLAEVSRAAAVEIEEVSRNSVKVAQTSGELLKQIVPDIQNTARLVQEITAASNEQNSGINQITSAITQLNTVAQQNAAAAEELSSNSETLSDQAQQLKAIISYFKVKDGQGSMNLLEAPERHSNLGQAKPVAPAAPTRRHQPTKGIKLDMNDNDRDFERF